MSRGKGIGLRLKSWAGRGCRVGEAGGHYDGKAAGVAGNERHHEVLVPGAVE